MRARILLIAAGAALLALSAAAHREGGYLDGAEPDIFATLPPPPTIGGPVDRTDRAIYQRTRALAGTPRWRMAQADSDKSARGLMADFSCAAGVALTPQDAPRVHTLIKQATPDIELAVHHAKGRFDRARPFERFGGQVCMLRPSDREASSDYPSGHAAKGWMVGLILAELAPDRTAAILARARAYGESRVVCGVHADSAIKAGQTTARVVVAALDRDAAFRADLASARGELAALRAAGPRPDAAVCREDQALTARTPW